MRIPNSTITITSNKNHGAVKQQPAWYAEMYREVWGRRVDPSTGVTVQPLPDVTPEALRYSEYGSVGQAELQTVQYFSGGTIKEEGEVAELFRKVFPNGLGAIIEKMLRADAVRLAEVEARNARPEVPHKSFLAAGCSPDEALAFQARNYATLGDVPANILLVTEVIANSAKAMRVIDQIEKLAEKAAGAPPNAKANPLGSLPVPAGAGAGG